MGNGKRVTIERVANGFILDMQWWDDGNCDTRRYDESGEERRVYHLWKDVCGNLETFFMGHDEDRP